MSSRSPLSIAIVGGGVGGLFAALCIHKHSPQVKIQVYEQANEYKEIGAGIGLGPNAVRLFAKLDLFDELDVLSSSTSTKGPDFRRFDTGAKLFNWPEPPKQTPNIRTIACARSELLDLLHSAVEKRDAAKLHHGMACTRLEENGSVATLHFANGSITTADLVIASDGIHSAIRNQFLTSRAVYSGQIAYRDVIPLSSLKEWPYEGYANMWLAKGSHFFVYPISNNKSLNIVAFIDKSESESSGIQEGWTALCDRNEVQRDFAEHEEAVQAIIQKMHPKPSRWLILDREPLDKWYFMNGKVILLGDAAHAMLPHIGAGAAQAMEDGWTIGRAIGDLCSKVSPFSTMESMAFAFQTARLPRAQKAQESSRIAGKTYDCQTADLIDLTFDECCPQLGDRIGAAMKWSWQEEVDLAYERARSGASHV